MSVNVWINMGERERKEANKEQERTNLRIFPTTNDGFLTNWTVDFSGKWTFYFSNCDCCFGSTVTIEEKKLKKIVKLHAVFLSFDCDPPIQNVLLNLEKWTFYFLLEIERIQIWEDACDTLIVVSL